MSAQSTLVDIATFFVISVFEPFFTERPTCIISRVVYTLQFFLTLMSAETTFVDVATIFVISVFEPLFTERFTCVISQVVNAFQVFLTLMSAETTFVDIKTVGSSLSFVSRNFEFNMR